MKHYAVKLKIELVRHVEARTKKEAESIAEDKGEIYARWDYMTAWKAKVTEARPGDDCYWSE